MFYFPAEYFLQVYSLPLTAEVRFQNDYFSEYPEQIRVSSERTAISYTRKSGYYAIHYNQPSKVPSGAILQLNEGAIAVFPGEPNQSEQGKVSPIYTVQPNGSLAIPTGLVFIRFAEGVNVESQREVINRAGYEVVLTMHLTLLGCVPNQVILLMRSQGLLGWKRSLTLRMLNLRCLWKEV
jgi:hypothetical protein